MNKEVKKNIIWAVISALSVIAFILIANKISPFTLDNDNIYLKTVVSGEMTGTPEPHSYYLGFISGLIISSLYKLTGNGIPWFGITLCTYAGIVIWYVLFILSKSCKKIYISIALWAITMLFTASVFYRYFAELQFTIIGGFLGAGAVFAISMVDEKQPEKNAFHLTMLFIFCLLSYSVRSSSFYMVIPFLGMIGLWKVINSVKNDNKHKFSAVVLCAAVVLISFAINLFISKTAYSSDEWKSYDRYNEAHADMVDYEGFPDYDTYIDTYEAYGITRSSYEALTKHYNLILDKNINEDSFTALDKITRQERKASNADKAAVAKKITTELFERNFISYIDRPINIFVFFIYLLVLILALISKKYIVLRDMAFIIVARMFDWVYLLYIGRHPFRVTQIIYIAELFALIALIINHKLWERAYPKILTKLNISPILLCAAMTIVFISVRFGLPVMEKTKNQVNAFNEMSVCFSQLEDYLSAHSGNFYFFDMSNLHYREKALEFKSSGYENYVYMGSWIANSPWYTNKLSAHSIDDPSISLIERDDVFIIYQISEGHDRSFLDYYFDEHFPGSKIEKADEFVSSNGFVYEILSVKRAD